MTGSREPGDPSRSLEAVTEELLELYEEVNVLYTVSEIAARSADLAVAGRRILEEAVSLLHADTGFIHYADRDLACEEPEPIGLEAKGCREIASLLEPRLKGISSAVVIAPFAEAAGVARAPAAVVAAPLVSEGERLGLLCLGKRGRESTFTSGDQKILSVLAVQAALIISQRRNLDLSLMARRLEERTTALRGILELGREISSSLDLERVLRALADLPARVLGFDRCAVLMEHRGRFRLRALSGVQRIDRAEPSVAALEDLLIWTAGRKVGFAARAEESESRLKVEAEPLASGEEADAGEFGRRATALFESGESRAILALPLSDDQGTLGVLSLEAAGGGALTEAAREAAAILALQATVAIRNGLLYKELPFISVLEPMRKGTRRLRRAPRRRLVGGAIVAGILAVLSVVLPWEHRVAGTFTLLPGKRIEAVAQVRGVIREISPLKEGDRIEEGEILAWIDDTDWRLRLNETEWRLQAALREAARLEAHGDAADLRIRKLEADRWRAERELLVRKIDQAAVRAPTSGILLTPRLIERTGELLEVGSVLCTLADLEDLRAEIAVQEAEADALERPLPVEAILKFQAFPDRDVAAEVRSIRPAAEKVNKRTSLIAEAIVTGSRDGLRPGMTGDARIVVGRTSLASLMARGTYRFVRRRLW